MKTRSQIIAITRMVILSSILSSCAVYPNKFKCSDAKGSPCTMLRDIDRKIDSGEIEEAYKEKQSNQNKQNKQKCSGGFCGGNKELEAELLPSMEARQTRLHIKDAMSADYDSSDPESVYF